MITKIKIGLTGLENITSTYMQGNESVNTLIRSLIAKEKNKLKKSKWKNYLLK